LTYFDLSDVDVSTTANAIYRRTFKLKQSLNIIILFLFQSFNFYQAKI